MKLEPLSELVSLSCESSVHLLWDPRPDRGAILLQAKVTGGRTRLCCYLTQDQLRGGHGMRVANEAWRMLMDALYTGGDPWMAL